jgi:hypothetical protein
MDRPGLSSDRARHRDRTTNSRPELLKRKHYLVKHRQIGLDTKTFWLTDWLTLSRKVTDSDNTQRLEKEAISGQTSTKWARRQDILTDWLTVSRKVTLTLTSDRTDLSSERASHRDRTTNYRPKLLKTKQSLVKRPQSWLDTKTYWVTDSQPWSDSDSDNTQRLEKEAISGQTSTKWARHQDILTDCQP